jgi:hypothetical protein
MPPAKPVSVSPRHRKGGLAQVVFETISGPGNACPQGGFRFLGFYGLRAARSAPSGIRRLAIARGDQFFL